MTKERIGKLWCINRNYDWAIEKRKKLREKMNRTRDYPWSYSDRVSGLLKFSLENIKICISLLPFWKNMSFLTPSFINCALGGTSIGVWIPPLWTLFESGSPPKGIQNIIQSYQIKGPGGSKKLPEILAYENGKKRLPVTPLGWPFCSEPARQD